MKTTFKFLLAAGCILFLFGKMNAQTKKAPAKKPIAKVIDKNFGAPTSVSQLNDLIESDAAYESVKSLIENYSVTITFADNTFRGKETLKRGDFIVALNSALISLKNAMNTASLDTSLINTYDRNRGGAYLTSVDQIKDVNANSIYYPAAKSLIERWGIGYPFAVNKTLSANSTISEKEVFDILHATLGYKSTGINPSSAAITRSKFAVTLNNAITTKMAEINSLHSIQQGKKDADRQHQLDSLHQADMAHKDSVAKEIEMRKKEAAQKEEEARKKLLEKNQNKN